MKPLAVYAYLARPFFLFMVLSPFMDALHLSALDQIGAGIGIIGFLFYSDEVTRCRLQQAKFTVSLKDAGLGVFPLPEIDADRVRQTIDRGRRGHGA